MKVHRSPIYNIRFRVSKISDPVWIGWALSFCIRELCLKAIKRKGSPQIESGVDAGDGLRALQTHAVWNDAFIILYYRGEGGGLHVLHAVIWDPTDTREYKCHYLKLLFFFNTCNALMILILVFSLCTNLSELSFCAWWTMKFQQVHHSACWIFRIAFKLSYSWTWPVIRRSKQLLVKRYVGKILDKFCL